MMDRITRRGLVSAGIAFGATKALGAAGHQSDPQLTARYAKISGERFAVPAINLSRIKSQFLRQTVSYDSSEVSGTIIVDPATRFLYRIEDGGTATRYGVGVGREGFGWSGIATIHDKREWPDWYPPREMFERQPELMHMMSRLPGGTGMAGGPRNPLGARAMYLWQDDQDTLYRIHGTIEPGSIGHSVSSGCIRMINQDVIDLYAKTPLETKVIVLDTAPDTSGRDQSDLSDRLEMIFPQVHRGSLW